MTFALVGITLLLLSGLGAILAQNRRQWAMAIGTSGTCLGSILVLIPTLTVLGSGQTLSLRWVWSVPFGSFFLEIDPLSAFFLFPVAILPALGAIYGLGYLRGHASEKPIGSHWFFYNLLAASMILVLTARNGVLFILAWEVMSIASFFLVTFEDDQSSVTEAGWIYLTATHLGAAFLFVVFILLGQGAGSLDFDLFEPSLYSPAQAGIIFLLAFIGFGSKAGLIPFHVWLPEAHPAAPSHVSAVMSGVMIKTGLYGIMRTLSFLGTPPAWWGWVLVTAGLLSGVLGVLYALAQHDLKRMLAYSSVENIGIAALGLGVGIFGQSANIPAVALLGYMGALLHVLNHAFFKGLLFLGAGSILHASGTRILDRLGGLLKSMPWTGATFLVGAIAISGLPPLNGFASEFLIYFGALEGGCLFPRSTAIPSIAVIAGLALIGGLALACFTKAFGTIFLGEPRQTPAPLIHEADWWMRIPMLILAAGCWAIGLFSPWIVEGMQPVFRTIAGMPEEAIFLSMTPILESMVLIAGVSSALIAGIAALFLFRRWLLSGRPIGQTVTWDCGYAAPSPRMQYSGSSFSQPILHLLQGLIPLRTEVQPPQGIFPGAALFQTQTRDFFYAYLFRPLFVGIFWSLAKLRWLQHGRLQLYVLYIAITLLILLVWILG